MRQKLLLNVNIVSGGRSRLPQLKVIFIPDPPHDIISFLLDVVLLRWRQLLLIMADEIMFVGRVDSFEERVENGVLLLDSLDAILSMLLLHHVLQIVLVLLHVLINRNLVHTLRSRPPLLGLLLDFGLK